VGPHEGHRIGAGGWAAVVSARASLRRSKIGARRQIDPAGIRNAGRGDWSEKGKWKVAGAMSRVS
jgi:hypothetical protein